MGKRIKATKELIPGKRAICRQCSTPFIILPGPGRRAIYCNDGCKQKYYRETTKREAIEPYLRVR